MELYYFPVSTYSHKVLVALYEKDIEFERKLVNLYSDEEKASFLNVYPMGKIPCLKVKVSEEQDRILPESSIIVEYLDQEYGGPNLLPFDKAELLEARLLDRMVDNYLIQPAVLTFFQSAKPAHMQDAERLDRAKFHITKSYKLLEETLAKRLKESAFLVGEAFSIADIAAVVGLSVASHFNSLDNYPLLSRFYKLHAERDSFVRVREEFTPALAKLRQILAKKYQTTST